VWELKRYPLATYHGQSGEGTGSRKPRTTKGGHQPIDIKVVDMAMKIKRHQLLMVLQTYKQGSAQSGIQRSSPTR
jgi:hypothetical protein